MRSIARRVSPLLIAIAVAGVVAGAGVVRAQPAGTPDARASIDAAPKSAVVTAAVEAVKADPNLTPSRMVPSLRWRDRDNPGPPAASRFAWLRRLVAWLSSSSRVLVWAGLLALGAILARWALRTLQERVPDLQGDVLAIRPTHVRDLDIRPESLPADVGAAALALWTRGDHRAAMALLYRGLLSRLVHVHQVPITSASTEGDCVRLSSARVDAGALGYVTGLVSTWQQLVYAHDTPATDRVEALCRGFDAALAPHTPPAESPA